VTSVWERYLHRGAGRVADRPWWWVLEDADTGTLCERQDGLRVIVDLTTLDELDAADRGRPLPCPPIAAGQVWHFPRYDIDAVVLRREGNSFWLLDYELDDHGSTGELVPSEWTTDQLPPTDDGGAGWLVWGPGAPWAPAMEKR